MKTPTLGRFAWAKMRSKQLAFAAPSHLHTIQSCGSVSMCKAPGFECIPVARWIFCVFWWSPICQMCSKCSLELQTSDASPRAVTILCGASAWHKAWSWANAEWREHSPSCSVRYFYVCLTPNATYIPTWLLRLLKTKWCMWIWSCHVYKAFVECAHKSVHTIT